MFQIAPTNASGLPKLLSTPGSEAASAQRINRVATALQAAVEAHLKLAMLKEQDQWTAEAAEAVHDLVAEAYRALVATDGRNSTALIDHSNDP